MGGKAGTGRRRLRKKAPKAPENAYEVMRRRQKRRAKTKAEWLKPMLEREQGWDLATGDRKNVTKDGRSAERRAISRITKKAVKLMHPERDCSVRWDRGTAHNWIDVKLSVQKGDRKAQDKDDPYRFSDGTRDIRQELEDTLLALGIRYSHYFPDALPGKDEWSPCLSINVEDEG